MPSGGEAMRVLVVEDEPLLAMAVEDALMELGFSDVCCVANLAAAGAFLSKVRPDLAILDVHLGNGLVYRLAEELSAIGVPIVFSTSVPRNEIPDVWASHPLVSKPLCLRDLVLAISSLGIAPR